MQAELIYRKPTVMTSSSRQELPGSQQQVVVVHHRAAAMPSNRHEGRISAGTPSSKDSRETIHSGHFMVSDFEAEAQDDEDELAVPVPDEEAAAKLAIVSPTGCFSVDKFIAGSLLIDRSSQQQLSIETSLNKLFQCMSLAYRQKLTSPKWNRFKGIRLRWKDKIRLNNVIWRCWHMQFILKQNTLVCQFASPLDVDTHNKPEAVVLEGKYWKRKLAAVTAEYKKWRMFYRNKILGWTNKDGSEMLESMDMLEWGSSIGAPGNYGTGMGNSCGGTGNTPSGDSMMVDEDYMELMTDTLFSTISSNQPIYFPDPREIARGASLADFIQPSLGPLQPNLDDFMDTLEPLQEFLNSKLPPVPEEDDMFRSNALNQSYPELDLIAPMTQINDLTEQSLSKNEQAQQQQQQTQSMTVEEQRTEIQNLQYSGKMYTQSQAELAGSYADNADMSDSYNTLQQNFQTTANTQPAREKPRQSRPSTRSSRVIQQRQQQQQQQQQQQANTYATNYQPQQAPQQTYAMEIQSVEIPNVQSQQISTQNEQQMSQNTQQISPLGGHVQNLVTLSTNFAAIQQKPIRGGTPAVPVVTTKPYKIVQAQQGYKFTPTTQSFTAQQCKYNSNNFKGIPAQQQLVPVAPQQSQTQAQQILLQCRPSPGLDLTATNVQTTKIQPGNNATTTVNVAPTNDKEEIFAVPKYQIKARSRSRSSSSLNAPRMHPPPLVTTVSDPALNLNNNVLLAHLLTNNSSGIYTTTEKLPLQSGTQSSAMKHILPMLPTTTPGTNARQVSNPVSEPQMQPSAGATQAIQPATTALLLNTNNQTTSSPSSPKESSGNAHSPQGLNLSPLHSPMSIGSPLSPSRSFVKGDSERGQYKEQRRVGHIHAEQKRRYNIKNGFDMLHSLIPQLSQNPNTKLSKAAMLQKGADYIRQLRAERNQLKEEMDSLRHQIECLNTSISNCQSMLPATGAPVSRHRTSKMKEMFDEYVRTRTRENWKFWIFSILLEPLMISFNTSVSTASVEDLYRSTILWVEQHCSLVDLRPAVLNSLRYLCTATDILSDPARLPEEALAAVNRPERRRSTN